MPVQAPPSKAAAVPVLEAATLFKVLFAAALPPELASTFCAAAVEALVAALPMPGATTAKVRLIGQSQSLVMR